jgi:WhiB family redox-sensing transcriptional regulator
MPTALFFGEGRRGRLTVTARVRALCASCPFERQCLEWAIAEEIPFGIWGGRTPEERRHLVHYRRLALAASSGP